MRAHVLQQWLTGEAGGAGQRGLEGARRAVEAAELPLHAADVQLRSLPCICSLLGRGRNALGSSGEGKAEEPCTAGYSVCNVEQ